MLCMAIKGGCTMLSNQSDMGNKLPEGCFAGLRILLNELIFLLQLCQPESVCAERFIDGNILTAARGFDRSVRSFFWLWGSGACLEKQKELDIFRYRALLWQREKDSNPHIRSQSPLCYLYTIPLYFVLLFLSTAANRLYYIQF